VNIWWKLSVIAVLCVGLGAVGCAPSKKIRPKIIPISQGPKRNLKVAVLIPAKSLDYKPDILSDRPDFTGPYNMGPALKKNIKVLSRNLFKHPTYIKSSHETMSVPEKSDVLLVVSFVSYRVKGVDNCMKSFCEAVGTTTIGVRMVGKNNQLLFDRTFEGVHKSKWGAFDLQEQAIQRAQKSIFEAASKAFDTLKDARIVSAYEKYRDFFNDQESEQCNGYQRIADTLNPERQQSLANTILHFSARNNMQRLTTFMIDQGADVNAMCDYSRQTALHTAASNNNPDIIRLLLDADADINAEDSNGRTALDYSSWNSRYAAEKILLLRDADFANVIKTDKPYRSALIVEDYGNTLYAAGKIVSARDCYEKSKKLYLASSTYFDNEVKKAKGKLFWEQVARTASFGLIVSSVSTSPSVAKYSRIIEQATLRKSISDGKMVLLDQIIHCTKQAPQPPSCPETDINVAQSHRTLRANEFMAAQDNTEPSESEIRQESDGSSNAATSKKRKKNKKGHAINDQALLEGRILTSAQIRKQFSDKTATCTHIKKKELLWRYFSPHGDLLQQKPDKGKKRGRWYASDKGLCIQMDGKTEICYRVVKEKGRYIQYKAMPSGKLIPVIRYDAFDDGKSNFKQLKKSRKSD
jgi:hypothetical protein